MAIAKPPVMTEADFLRLSDDGHKYELIDGEVKEVPTSPWHEEISAWIISLMMPFARGRGSLTASSAGFRMTGGNIRAPDISFTRRERLPDGQATRRGFGDYTPDLCIEIISPSEDEDEMAQKVREYFASGAQQVWHLFPESLRVLVYTEASDPAIYESDNEIDGGNLLPGFRCRVGELFDV